MRFPLVTLVFKNAKEKRVASWTRRFARALQSEETIEENMHLDDIREILEKTLKSTCTTDWEEQNLRTILANDGSKDSMQVLLPKLVDRIKAKAGAGATGGSRYGPLSVALANDAAVSHKAECEPTCVFRATSAELAAKWPYFHPRPPSGAPLPGRNWELRLTTRHWKDDGASSFCLSRGYEPGWLRRDDVCGEAYHGTYAWNELHHHGDTYDEYELELTLPTFGNTEKLTGDGSELTVLYRRDVDQPKHLKYVSHDWGRTSTSEMENVDTHFPPELVEGAVEELDDDAVGALITMSLTRLKRGAQAGVEEHEAHLPGEREKIVAESFRPPDDDDDG